MSFRLITPKALAALLALAAAAISASAEPLRAAAQQDDGELAQAAYFARLDRHIDEGRTAANWTLRTPLDQAALVAWPGIKVGRAACGQVACKVQVTHPGIAAEQEAVTSFLRRLFDVADEASDPIKVGMILLKYHEDNPVALTVYLLSAHASEVLAP